MKKYAIVNNSTNLVENIIVWDGETLWTPPEGHIAVNIDDLDVGIGWTYNNGIVTAPNPEIYVVEKTNTPTLTELQAQLAIITQQMAALANTSG